MIHTKEENLKKKKKKNDFTIWGKLASGWWFSHHFWKAASKIVGGMASVTKLYSGSVLSSHKPLLEGLWSIFVYSFNRG